MAILCTTGIVLGAGRHPAQAMPPSLQLPLACDIPDRCFVEFYVDHAAGPTVADHRCGNRSYDTHRGTDFRVRSPADFAAGIPVLAAADGTVAATRDEMADIDVGELGRDKVANRASGNTVLLRHEDGWTTLYGHLRRGSVAVKPGDKVKAGQRLGLVGLSGDTNFPHLHFELRDAHGAVTDPFNANAQTAACRQSGQAMWSTSALATLSYRPVDAMAGFAERNPGRDQAIYGRLKPPHQGGQLFFWFELFGVRRDDVYGVQFVLADGTLRRPATGKVTAQNGYIYRSAGLSPDIDLRPGRYGAVLSLIRAGQTIFERRFEIEVE